MLGGVEQALERLLVMIIEIDMKKAHKPGLWESDEQGERHGGKLCISELNHLWLRSV